MSNRFDPAASGLCCVITGVTSGIGQAITTDLAARGAALYAVGRTSSSTSVALTCIRERAPGARVVPLSADLSVLDQVRTLAEQINAQCERLDVLVLNAGVARPRREVTPDGFETDFATNHLSPFFLTQLLWDLLVASAPARVVVVSSSVHRNVTGIDFAGLPTGIGYHPTKTYAVTKLCNVLFTTELARRLQGAGVTANAADPGFVRTRLGRELPGAFGAFLKLARPFQASPAKAARTPVFVATAPELADATGGYFAKCRAGTPSSLGSDQATAHRLWELSAELIAGRPTL